MEKIYHYIKIIFVNLEKLEFSKAFDNLHALFNHEEFKQLKEKELKEIIEVLILMVEEIAPHFIGSIHEEKRDKILIKIYGLLEELKLYSNPIISNDFCYAKSGVLKTGVFERFMHKKKRVRVISEKAPKFYMKGDKREFNTKIETKNLKNKNRKLKKKLIKELQVETNLMLDKNKNKQNFFMTQKKQKMNLIMSELQKQQKIIERENTSVVKNQRIKKVRKRKAGNNF